MHHKVHWPELSTLFFKTYSLPYMFYHGGNNQGGGGGGGGDDMTFVDALHL